MPSLPPPTPPHIIGLYKCDGMVLILLFAVLFYTVTLLVADVVIVVVVAFNFSFEFDAPRKRSDEERVISFDIVVTDDDLFGLHAFQW